CKERGAANGCFIRKPHDAAMRAKMILKAATQAGREQCSRFGASLRWQANPIEPLLRSLAALRCPKTAFGRCDHLYVNTP
ncbi:MAG: hypothetical protein Q7J29_04130, partial [Stagnimonas sp.]|nr:hypothetical protein [Stagnimonas sp.]